MSGKSRSELFSIEQIADLMRRAGRPDMTVKRYTDMFRIFRGWCSLAGKQDLPARPETVASWLADLASPRDGGTPRSSNTSSVYFAAVKAAHEVTGHRLDEEHPVLSSVLKRVRRTATDLVRKARPLLADDLRLMLKRFDPLKAGDARDGAMLALGWSGAMRRSEIICLDWERLGEGMGFVRVDERGVEVVLMTSKGSQDAATVIAIPAADMPAATEWLGHWAKAANLQPGEPVFMRVANGGKITRERITDRTVSDRIKVRVRDWALSLGYTKEQAEDMAQQSSGESLRRGFRSTANSVASIEAWRAVKPLDTQVTV